MGLGWDAGCDVDGSVALFNKNRKAVEAVWWNNLKSSNGAVQHSGDDRTGEGAGDDEVINVDLDKLPLDIHYLVFNVCVFTGGMSFAQVRSAYVRMVSANPSHKNHEMARYNLTGLQGTAMLLGMLTRQGAYWTFTALGTPATGRTIQEVIKDTAAMSAILSLCPSRDPGVRHITLRVLKGRNLVAKDRGGLFKKKSTSDPFVKIKYKRLKLQSDVIPKTLDPVWTTLKPLDLGNVMESESKAVKMTVWDYDKLSGKDFMGALRLPAAALYARGPGRHEWWVELTRGKKSKYQNSKVSGDIFVECTIEDVHIPEQTGMPPPVMPPQGQGYPPAAQPGGPSGYPPVPQGPPGGYAAPPQGGPGYGYPGPPQGRPGGYPGYPPAGGYPPPGAYPPAGGYPGGYPGAATPQGPSGGYHGPAAPQGAPGAYSTAHQAGPDGHRIAEPQGASGGYSGEAQGESGGNPAASQAGYAGAPPTGYPTGTRDLSDHPTAAQGGPAGYPAHGGPAEYSPAPPGPRGGYPQWSPQSQGSRYPSTPPQQTPHAPYPGSGQMPQQGSAPGGYPGVPASVGASAPPYPPSSSPQVPGGGAWPPPHGGGQAGAGAYPEYPGYPGHPGAYWNRPSGGAQ
ncbi:unnamed protein product [Ostreobium quekettii]|uniref:C2 domain-containing protein n=1 Tax=Ostreobium quekettii TaxID=121088 RepID=A0A8S1J2V3_9CHLO|nr:unnamed protein product [Ostreobium quekettii]